MTSDRKIQLSCQKATALIEKKREVNLSFLERVKLLIHVKMCNVCKAYIKQSDMLDKGMQVSSNLKNTKSINTAELQKKIIQKLNSENNL